MKYLLTALALLLVLCCLSVAVQAQPPGYRMQCDGNSCRLVPIGPSVSSPVTTQPYAQPSYSQPYSQPYSTTTTYYQPQYQPPTYTYVQPLYVQPMYAAPPRRTYTQTWVGPFGGSYQRSYSSGACGNPWCGCGNCRCVNCACGY